MQLTCHYPVQLLWAQFSIMPDKSISVVYAEMTNWYNLGAVSNGQGQWHGKTTELAFTTA